MAVPGRNDPCHCGSGKKYKKCHLEIDRDARRAFIDALPVLQEQMAKAQEYDRRLRDEFGIHINYVSPVEFQGRKVWAIGSRVYPSRPPNETFHEFLLHVLRNTFGEAWRAEQAELPEGERHFVFRCFEELQAFLAANADSEALARTGFFSAEPNGWVSYLIRLAWDVATLIHAADLPDALVARLRHPTQFQGARYEVAIAALFARLDCAIRFLDEDEELRGAKHVEFEATHRPSGQAIAVEAKSRHRSGVLNEPGSPDTVDPLKKDERMVRQLFMKALEKAPEGMPFFIFIDVNAPTDPSVETRWRNDLQRWMSRLPSPTATAPDRFNALFLTNFSPHYDGDDISRGGSWLGVFPLFTREPLKDELMPPLQRALDTYGGVPAFEKDGTLL